jgi:hypothetical protein
MQTQPIGRSPNALYVHSLVQRSIQPPRTFSNRRGHRARAQLAELSQKTRVVDRLVLRGRKKDDGREDGGDDEGFKRPGWERSVGVGGRRKLDVGWGLKGAGLEPVGEFEEESGAFFAVDFEDGDGVVSELTEDPASGSRRRGDDLRRGT